MIFLPIVTVALLLACGTYALKQNSARPTNRILAAICFIGSLVQALQVVARIQGARYWTDPTINPLPWVRARYMVIAILCPFLIWACFYLISGQYKSRRDLVKKLFPWGLVSVVLMCFPALEAFKPSNSRPDNLVSGPLFTVYLVIVIVSMASLCVASLLVGSRLSGIRKLEFRFITVTFGYLGLAVFSSTLINALYPHLPGIEFITKTLSFFVWVAFGASVWSVTNKRVYETDQLILPLLQRFLALALVAIPAGICLHFLPRWDDSMTAEIGALALFLLAFLHLDQRLRSRLNLTAEASIRTAAARIRTATSNMNAPEEVLRESAAILTEYLNGVPVHVVTQVGPSFSFLDITLEPHELTAAKINESGWLSTHSLARTRSLQHTDRLLEKLARTNIQLLLVPQETEQTPGILVAIEERENRHPFTFPEIQALRALIEVVHGLYVRSRFALQARQAEQLATIGLVGASIAHELRNPIVTIRTFAELLPSRYEDAQFLQDFAEVIPSEGRRVQKLAEQLLDLARPRRYQFAKVDIRGVIDDVVILVKKQSRDHGVAIEKQLPSEPVVIFADPDALRQVVLNLLLNSIESLASFSGPRQIYVVILPHSEKVEIQVADNGRGIPPSVLNRVFEPFASADKEKGLGLGLAICAEIARIHKGTIRGENRPEGGAIFSLMLPVEQSSFYTVDSVTT